MQLGADGADFAFVGGAKGGSLSVIDTSTHSLVSTLALTGGVGGIVAAPGGESLYVTNPALDTVTIFDVVKRYVSNIIPVRSGPTAIVMTPDGANLVRCKSGR